MRVTKIKLGTRDSDVETKRDASSEGFCGQVPAATSRAILHGLFVACMAATTPAARAAPEVPPSQFVDAARKQKLIQALPQIETLMSDRIKELGIPGLAYGIVIGDELVLAKGLGLRDVASGTPVDVDTVFRIASMTKNFTALAILKLRDAGKLSLDDPVARYVPEVGTWQLPTSESGPITMRQDCAKASALPGELRHHCSLGDVD